MIKIKDLNISFGKQVILEDINLDIEPAKITGIIAPSGAGKTTLFNAIMGLQKVSSGEILYDNQLLDDKKMYRKIAYMPQEGGIYEDLTGKENVKFFAKLEKVKISSDEIIQLFKEFDLSDALNKKVNNYSGGMKKKLGLMITLLGDSQYYFLDEPTVGIDPVQKEEFWKKLESLKATGKTIIVTTHVMDEASRCDQLVFLRNHKIIANETQKNILKMVDANNLNEAFIKLAGGYDE